MLTTTALHQRPIVAYDQRNEEAMARLLQERMGARVRAVRERAEWTQIQLAARLRLSSAQMSRYETGRSALTFEMLHRISKIFGVPFVTLVNVETEDLPVPSASPVPPKTARAPITTDVEELRLLSVYRKLTPHFREIALMLISELRRADTRKRPEPDDVAAAKR